MRLLFTALLVMAFSPAAGAVEFKFADTEKAAEILLSQDAYFERMSAPEIAIRLQSESADKTAADLKARYVESLRDWSAEEIQQFQAVIEEHWPAMERISHLLPDEIYFIRGTPGIEGGLPHTHANAIIIQTSIEELSPFLLFHEIFHVLSRHNGAKQPEIYGILGFKACRFEEPGDIAAIHLTNPDVPFDGYYLPVDIKGEAANVIPFLYAAYPAFDPGVENGFGGHFGFGLIGVEVLDGVCRVKSDGEGKSVIHPVSEVPGYLEALGGNTGYIIHPEETIADNFVFLLLGHDGLKTPEIPEKIGAWLDAQD